MRTVAVVLAGGSGERFGTPVPKQLLPLAGRPMIEHSVAAFEQAPAVDQIMVVMAAGHAEQVRALLGTGGYAKLGKRHRRRSHPDRVHPVRDRRAGR